MFATPYEHVPVMNERAAATNERVPVEYGHIPVMVEECLSYLSVKRDGVYIDCTIGGAGHALRILEKQSGKTAVLIGIDRDRAAADVSALRLAERVKESGSGVRCEVVCANYADIDKICDGFGIKAVDGILLDLGVSSHQLDEAGRGFSYRRDDPLDMRMDQSARLTAADIVNLYPERELAEIIYRFGEERWAARIAKFIVTHREKKPFRSTQELVETILSAVPKNARDSNAHPARRTFQAIRIAVNDELGTIAETLEKASALLRENGRLAVISFHSLEDRIVKNAINGLSAGCVCPKDMPVCVCGRRAVLKKITRKPVLPAEEEIKRNPRARSAKLRVAEKLAGGGDNDGGNV